MTDYLPVLLALGWDDLFKFLLPFVLLLIWVISQISEAKKQAGPPKGKQPALPPRPEEAAAPRRPREARPARAADPLRDQVDEFLRRAGREPMAEEPAPVRASRRPQPPAADEIEILLSDDVSSPHREPLAEPLRPIEQQAAASGGPPGPGKKPRAPRRGPAPHRETVGEHAERIGSHARSLEEHAPRLGQRLARDDAHAQFDVQLKARFDHTLGALGTHSTAPAESLVAPPSDAPAAQIAAMLSSPEGVRQAIVINEILRRPSDQW